MALYSIGYVARYYGVGKPKESFQNSFAPSVVIVDST